jgi:lysophospholipase-2
MPSKTLDPNMEPLTQHNPHTVPPKERHTHTIIFLHGGESNAKEFATDFFESQASDNRSLQETFPSVKWVFPNSATRNMARFDMEESQWFDLWDVRNPQERRDLQIEGLRENIAFILNVIRKEASIVPPDHIVLGGISQGCATAIHALLYGGIRLGGFIGLSSWLPFEEDINIKARWTSSDFTMLQNIRKIFKPANIKSTMPQPFNEIFPAEELAFKTPVFLSHSKDDDVVPFKNGDMLWWRLEEDLGFDVDWKVYEDGGHWINEPNGVDDIEEFLRKVLV